MFWEIVAWLSSLILAWIMGEFTIIDAVNKHPERIGLEKIKEVEGE